MSARSITLTSFPSTVVRILALLPTNAMPTAVGRPWISSSPEPSLTAAGGVIVSARSEGFCDSSTFKSQLSDCLKCANEFDIWKYYGGSVSKAAESCGLDSTPEDAGEDDSSTMVQPATTTSAGSSATVTEASTEESTAKPTPSSGAEEATTAPGTTAPSATQSFTTTTSAPGSSHPVIPTGSTTTPISGSPTPTGQAVRYLSIQLLLGSVTNFIR